MLMKHARECDPVPAMQTVEHRVAESTVDAALQRLAASGVDASRAVARSLLVAEFALGDLGVECDLVGRLVVLEAQYAAAGLRHPAAGRNPAAGWRSRYAHDADVASPAIGWVIGASR